MSQVPCSFAGGGPPGGACETLVEVVPSLDEVAGEVLVPDDSEPPQAGNTAAASTPTAQILARIAA